MFGVSSITMKFIITIFSVLCFSFISAQQIPVANPNLKPFYHGVASGDPLEDRVIIWTRYTPESSIETSAVIQWEIASDLSFSAVLQTGSYTTDGEKDWTVKIDVADLLSGKTYYYRFRAPDGTYSLYGRTKTAPAASVSNLRFAVISCSSIFSGYFNAYKRIAERADLDAVIHLGDYIYDFVDQDEPIRVRPEDSLELITLKDFRDRHAYYHLDPDLRAAHQQHPFLIMWDNHDISWSKSDSISMPKYNDAIRAFYEWTPIRIPADRNKLQRSLTYGNLAEIILTDVTFQRYKPFSPPGSNSNDDPNRKLWGDEQYAWLTNRLLTSASKWKIVGLQKQFGQWNLVGLPLGTSAGISLAGLLSDGDVNQYHADRVRLLSFLREHSISNTIMVSGDLHMSFAMDLAENPFNPQYYNQYTGDKAVAVEFQPGSVTRVNLDEKTKGILPPSIVAWLTQISSQINIHHRFTDLTQHGYGLLDLREEKATGEFWFCNKLIPDNFQKMDAAYEVYQQVNHWNRQKITTPSIPLLLSSPLAPFESIPTSLYYKERLNATLVLYPNPADDIVTLNLSGLKPQPVTISLVDIGTGRLLKQIFKGIANTINEFEFSVSDLPESMVLILVESEEGKAYKKLTVVH
jgi:alkaline phosphatase D